MRGITAAMSSAPLPFLPEPEPLTPAAPPPKKSATKTLVLWVVLIVMFLAIWQFLTPSGAAPPKPELPPCESSPSYAALWVGVAAMALFVFVYRWFMKTYAQSLEFNVAQEPARLAIAERRFDAALEIFARTRHAYAKKPAYEASASLALGHAQMSAGRLDQAIETLATVERGRKVLFSSAVRTLAAAHLAFAQALAGQLEASERWATEARSRLGKNRDDRIDYAARLCLAEAVVMLRRGRPEDASALLEKNWTVMREVLNGNTMRVAEVLSAFAESARGVRQSNTMAERLVRVEPVRPGDFTFLGVQWPEMQAFLAAHGLGA